MTSIADVLSGNVDEQLQGVPATPEQLEAAKMDAYVLSNGDIDATMQAVEEVQTKDDAEVLSLQAKQQLRDKLIKEHGQNILADPSTTPQEKAATLQGLPNAVESNTSTPEQRVAALRATLASNMQDTAVRAVAQQAQLRILADETTAKMWEDTSTWDAVGDMASLFVPAVYGTAIKNASQAIKLNKGGLADYAGIVAVGETLNTAALEASKLPPEQLISTLEALKSYDGNVYAKMTLVAAIKDAVDKKDGYNDVGRAIEDLFGVVDVAPFIGAAYKMAGKILKKGVKVIERTAAGSKAVGLPVSDNLAAIASMTQDPKAAAKLTSHAISQKLQNGEDASKELTGILNTRLIDDAIDDAASIGARPEIIKELEKVKTATSNVRAEELPNAKLLSDEEMLAAQERAKTDLSSLEGLSVHRIRFDVGEGAGEAGSTQGFDVHAIYGAPDGRGFPSFIEAQAGRKLLGERAKNAEITVYDRANNTWHDSYNSSIEAPEFYVDYKAKHTYDIIEDQMAETMGTTFFRGNWMKGDGWVTSYLKDNGNRYKSFILNAANVAEDTKGTLRSRLRAVTAPLFNLSHGSQGRVLDILEQGSKHKVKNESGEVVSIGKNYTIPELLAIDPTLTDKEIAAYYAARTAMDMTDSLKNIAIRKSLERQGMKHYSAGNINLLAKPLSNKPTITHALDLETGDIIRVSQEDIDAVYEGGGHIAKLRSDYKVGDESTTHVLVKQGNRMHDLPQRVLNYREGYIHRFYKEKWFVKVVENIRKDGKPDTYTHTVAAFGNKADAEVHKIPEHLQKLVDEGKATVEIKIDRHTGVTSEGEIALTSSEGRLFTARRGEELKGNSNQELARTEDILTSLEKDINSTAHLYTHDDVAAALTKRLHTAYPDDFDHEGKLVANASKGAQEAQKFIDLFNGVPTMSDRVGRAIMIKVSNALEAKGYKRAAKAVFNRSGFSLAQAQRSAAFALFIAANPIKQLYLQGTQFLMLALAHPKLAAKSVVQAFAMEMNYAARNTRHARAIEKAMAKLAGVDVREFRAMNKMLADTGLLQSINNHAMLQNYAALAAGQGYKEGLARVGQIVGNTIKAPFALGQKAGFTAGEAHNLTTSWLLVHNLWKESNPGKKWMGNADIAAEWGAKARQWTLNANKIGSFKMQRGLASTTTQFWAFQLKAWAAILSSEAFTKSERTRMAIGMGALWGATGYGVFGEEAWNALEEQTGGKIPPLIRDIFEHGLADKFLNDMLTLAGGTDEAGNRAEIDFSGSASPLAGIGLITNFITEEGTPLEILSGVSGYAYSNIGNAISLAHRIWQVPDTSTLDKTLKTVQTMADILPLVGNAHRGMIGLGMLRHISKSTLTADERITASEAVMQALTGFMSRKELEAIELRMNAKEGQKDALELGKEMARIFNDRFADEVRDTNGNLSPASWKKIEDAMQVFTMEMAPETKFNVMKGFRLYSNTNLKQRDALGEYLKKVILTSDSKDAVLAYIQKSVRLTKSEKEQASALAELMYENMELGQDIIKKGIEQ